MVLVSRMPRPFSAELTDSRRSSQTRIQDLVEVASVVGRVEVGQVAPAGEQGHRIGPFAGQGAQLGDRLSGSGHGQALACLYAVYGGVSVFLKFLEGYRIIHSEQYNLKGPLKVVSGKVLVRMGNGDELESVDSYEILWIGCVERKIVGYSSSGDERIVGTG